MKYYAVSLLFFAGIAAGVAFDGNSKKEIARISIRPIEETERRFAIAPLVFINDNSNQESYGLDLPEPGYEQCYLSQPSSAYPTGTKKMRVVRLVDRQCWGLLLTHPKWLKVPPTGSVPILTVPGFVQTK